MLLLPLLLISVFSFSTQPIQNPAIPSFSVQAYSYYINFSINTTLTINYFNPFKSTPNIVISYKSAQFLFSATWLYVVPVFLNATNAVLSCTNSRGGSSFSLSILTMAYVTPLFNSYSSSLYGSPLSNTSLTYTSQSFPLLLLNLPVRVYLSVTGLSGLTLQYVQLSLPFANSLSEVVPMNSSFTLRISASSVSGVTLYFSLLIFCPYTAQFRSRFISEIYESSGSRATYGYGIYYYSYNASTPYPTSTFTVMPALPTPNTTFYLYYPTYPDSRAELIQQFQGSLSIQYLFLLEIDCPLGYTMDVSALLPVCYNPLDCDPILYQYFDPTFSSTSCEIVCPPSLLLVNHTCVCSANQVLFSGNCLLCSKIYAECLQCDSLNCLSCVGNWTLKNGVCLAYSPSFPIPLVLPNAPSLQPSLEYEQIGDLIWFLSPGAQSTPINGQSTITILIHPSSFSSPFTYFIPATPLNGGFLYSYLPSLSLLIYLGSSLLNLNSFFCGNVLLLISYYYNPTVPLSNQLGLVLSSCLRSIYAIDFLNLTATQSPILRQAAAGNIYPSAIYIVMLVSLLLFLYLRRYSSGKRNNTLTARAPQYTLANLKSLTFISVLLSPEIEAYIFLGLYVGLYLVEAVWFRPSSGRALVFSKYEQSDNAGIYWLHIRNFFQIGMVLTPCIATMSGLSTMLTSGVTQRILLLGFSAGKGVGIVLQRGACESAWDVFKQLAQAWMVVLWQATLELSLFLDNAIVWDICANLLIGIFVLSAAIGVTRIVCVARELRETPTSTV